MPLAHSFLHSTYKCADFTREMAFGSNEKVRKNTKVYALYYSWSAPIYNADGNSEDKHVKGRDSLRATEIE